VAENIIDSHGFNAPPPTVADTTDTEYGAAIDARSAAGSADGEQGAAGPQAKYFPAAGRIFSRLKVMTGLVQWCAMEMTPGTVKP
jgi:hypothetical protein